MLEIHTRHWRAALFDSDRLAILTKMDGNENGGDAEAEEEDLNDDEPPNCGVVVGRDDVGARGNALAALGKAMGVPADGTSNHH